jgi:hypothetical protein
MKFAVTYHTDNNGFDITVEAPDIRAAYEEARGYLRRDEIELGDGEKLIGFLKSAAVIAVTVAPKSDGRLGLRGLESPGRSGTVG